MNVALYTIFRCTNYGAVLQAYALTRTLRGVPGVSSVDVINHRMDPRDTHLLGKITNPSTPWFQRWRNKRKFASRYFRPELFEARRTNTIRIIDEYIRPTRKLYASPQELHGLPMYNTVIVGSDQVWNPILNRDFGKNQYLGTNLPESQDRTAYAASFGVSELPENCLAEYRDALARFRKITVREESGADICQRLFPDAPSPKVVLDPTMLLTEADWLKVVRDAHPCPVGRRYLAAYWVRTLTDADMMALANISKEIGIPVCLMSAGQLPRLDFATEIVPYVDADPFDFVRTIAEAYAVVTDSFHGLQFATLFRKPFLALGNIGDQRSNASRLLDFCSRYRIVGGIQDIGDFRRRTPFHLVDFSTSTIMELDKDRAYSLECLKGLLP